MKKLSALLLTLILTLSLAACKKDATSSDASGLSNIPSQAEQSETDISAEQTSGITAESEAESKTEPAPTSTTPDKKSNTSKSTPKQDANSQPKSGTPAQNPNNNKTTQPTKPTKLNPKTNFKFGKYVAKYFDNNNQSYHTRSFEFFKDLGSVELQQENYYTKEYYKKDAQERGEVFSEDDFYSENQITVNGTTYYEDIYGTIVENFEITDTAVRVNRGDEWIEFSLNADGTMTVDKSADFYADVGTVFALAQ